MLEWAAVHDHRYGTPRRPVTEALETGHDVLFDIDWQGARSISAAMPDNSVRAFVLPPSTVRPIAPVARQSPGP